MNANYTVYDSLVLDYQRLGEGETRSGEVCPSCQGGPSKEKSFSITRRDGALLFTCHRASCTFKGTVGLAGNSRSGTAGESEAKERASYPRIQSSALCEATIRLLSTRYCVPRAVLQSAGLKWSGDEHNYFGRRVCFPIHGPSFAERGTSYRSYEKGVVPKAIVELRTPDDIKASWYKWIRKKHTLFIVEDQMSAIKLAPHTHAVALLGTEVSEQLVEEIKEGGYDHVRICLDKDAITTAIKLQLTLRNKIKGIEVLGLAKDIKDMSVGEFNDWLSKYVQ